jgi:hypothetical protein
MRILSSSSISPSSADSLGRFLSITGTNSLGGTIEGLSSAFARGAEGMDGIVCGRADCSSATGAKFSVAAGLLVSSLLASGD